MQTDIALCKKPTILVIMFTVSLLVGCLPKDFAVVEDVAEEGSPRPSPRGEPIPAPAKISCDTESLGYPVAPITTSVSHEIIPLCNGELIIQNRIANRIEHIKVSDSTPLAVWQLTATPSHMLLDTDEKYLYVTLEGLARVARIDVTVRNSNIDYIYLSAPGAWVTFGEADQMFVNLTPPNRYAGNIDLVDLKTLSKIKTFVGNYDRMGVYSSISKQFIMTSSGLSPCGIARYEYDPVTMTLTLKEDIHDGGSSCTNIMKTSDETRYIIQSGSGNTIQYALYDYSFSNTSATNGAYNFGTLFDASAFSPDEKYLLIGNESTLKLFDTVTHAVSKQYNLNFGAVSGCTFPNLKRLGFSRGGKTIYAYFACGYFASDTAFILAIER